MAFHLIKHSLVEHKMAQLRNKKTEMVEFRRLTHELGTIVISEITKNWEVESIDVETPCGTAHCNSFPTGVVLVPVLRAGLEYLEGALTLLPDAKVGHIGLYRNEHTHRPVSYLTKLPTFDNSRIVLIDPMLATGYSLLEAVDILLVHGAKLEQISVMTLVAAPEGVKVFTDKYPTVELWTAALDECLNDDAYIVPGLGDAGDRIFGTH